MVLPTVHSRPTIRRLSIRRFRGIEGLVWYPSDGTNVILGAGDVGKSTILDAIGLLLHPTNSTVLSDADYFDRDVDQGFEIEAVMSLPEHTGIHELNKHAWPWNWDGREPQLPGEATAADPVYRLCVRGDPEFELLYELLQPDESRDHLSVGLRQRIGLVRLSGDDRNDRDLRLVQGSALDRLLADKSLRSRVGHSLGSEDIEEQLLDEAKIKLEKLDTAFKESALPSGLGIGLMAGHGLSLNALVGLTATKHKLRLPLASWGAGTRRLAALKIAEQNQAKSAITLVDEVERGLEPYRQRALVTQLEAANAQVFLTTHSSAAVRAISQADIWRTDLPGSIAAVPADVRDLLVKDPEALLARLTIVVEGVTEKGFVTALLERASEIHLLDCGIWVTSAQGVAPCLTVLEAAAKAGLTMAGFADREGPHQDRWTAVENALGKLVFRWPTGMMEKYVVSLVSDENLEAYINDPDGQTGMRVRTLAERIGIEGKTSFAAVKARADDVRKLIGEASTGFVPDNLPEKDAKAWRNHERCWFKSLEGGRELVDKVFTLGLWPALKKDLLPFVNAVRRGVTLREMEDIS